MAVLESGSDGRVTIVICDARDTQEGAMDAVQANRQG
jgi:hypothetical protein